jgi:hypothetical protein
VIKAFYTPLVKVSRDAAGAPKPYPPTFKLALRKKLPKKGGAGGAGVAAVDPSTQISSFETEFYDPSAATDDKGKMSLFPGATAVDQVLVKRSQVSVIAQCTGIWFAGGKFGTTWKSTQIRVDSQPEQIRGPAFRSDAPDIRAFIAKKVAAEAASAAEAGGDEYEDDAEEESAVSAVLPPKKAAATVSPAAPAPAAPAAPAFVEESVAEPIPVPKKIVKKVVAKVAPK